MIARSKPSPVTPEHLAALASAQKALSDAQGVISQLEAVGEDVSQYRQLSQHWDQKLRKVQQVFGGQT